MFCVIFLCIFATSEASLLNTVVEPLVGTSLSPSLDQLSTQLSPVLDPLDATLDPVVEPVIQELQPVTTAVEPVLEPVATAVAPVVEAVVGVVAPVVGAILGSKIKNPAPIYRSYDGSKNNKDNPTWGTPNTPFERFLTRSTVRDVFNKSMTGNCLMAPSKISSIVAPDKLFIDPIWTTLTIAYGQMLAHDMSLAKPDDSKKKSRRKRSTSNDDTDEENTCSAGNEDEDDTCSPTVIPEEENPGGKTPLAFSRSVTTGCPSEPVNAVNSFHDLSNVYGNSLKRASELRTFKCGKMKQEQFNGNDFLPTWSNPAEQCVILKKVKNNICFKAGDDRVNQNLHLTILQTALVRTHNSIADTLCKMNKKWDDEKVFQTTRVILIAMIQSVTYYQFLPFILGKDNMIKKKIFYENPTDYIKDYDSSVNPSIINEHATAGFRAYHSTIVAQLLKLDNKRKKDGQVRLSDWLDNVSLLVELGIEKELALGFTTQLQNNVDRFYSVEVTKFLFRGNGKVGMNLFARDINRGRDHRLGSYVCALKKCKLSNPKSFKDLEKFIKPQDVKILKKVYKNIEDIELMVGGIFETIISPFAISGPTFNCIMLQQFYNTRLGDRFFFENGNNGLTLDQLNSIRSGSSLSGILCNAIKGFDEIQAEAFAKITKGNPLIKCKDIPTVDLTLWQD